MGKKRKTIVRLAADEVAVVWPMDAWKHMIMTYETLGGECIDLSEQAYWLDAANYIKLCIEDAETAEFDDE